MPIGILKRGMIFYDGAMGTMLQANGLKLGERPDIMNITAPEVVARIHKMYVDAGSNVICTNTFGANAKNLGGTGYSVQEIVSAGVQLALDASAGRASIALDIGPIGDFIAPMGGLDFEDAYTLFAEQAIAGAAAGADLVAIETMSDLAEVKAAVLAVRENTSLPIFVTMTFGENGRTFTGCRPESFAILAERLGVSALGVNCSLQPEHVYPVVKVIATNTSLPVIAKPNAGLPEGETGGYTLQADTFAEQMKRFAGVGVKVMGGCCGTTPAYIKELCRVCGNLTPQTPEIDRTKRICSPMQTAKVLDIVNDLREDDAKKSLDDIVSEACDRADTEENILSVRIPDGCEPQRAALAIREIQSMTPLPLYLILPGAMYAEPVLRAVNGIAAVSCRERSDPFLHAVRKYGAYII
jgi:5-methyltetrahydrofolate--homocysteine methyltransferase